jgi:hypothetical protein
MIYDFSARIPLACEGRLHVYLTHHVDEEFYIIAPLDIQ